MAKIGSIQDESIKTAVRFQNTPDDSAANAQRVERNSGTKADTVVFQRTPQIKKQAEELFADFLKRLQKVYPELRIVVSDGKTGSNRNLLTETLKGMGDGYVLMLSGEFMESLGADEEAYRSKAQAVLDAVKRLGSYKNGAAVWMGEDAAAFLIRQPDQKTDNVNWIKEWSQRQEKHLSDMLPSPSEQELIKSRALSSAYYQTATAYSRLARAKTKTAAQSVVTEIRQSISSLKLVAAYGDDKLRLKAKKAQKALEKLLLRADRKLQRFDEERLTDIRRKRAQENEQKEKEMQAELELKRRKTSRATGDGAILTEGRLNNVNIPGHRNWLEEQRLKKQYKDTSYDWMTYAPVNPTMATDIIASAEVLVGDMALPEGFHVAEVVTF